MSTIQEKASRLLGDNPTLPISVELIAAKLGIRLLPYDLGDSASGVLIIENGMATIGYNKNESKVRNRFTIAHEIGHYELHKDSDLFVDKDFKVMYRNGETISPIQEKEANEFAACLLMPAELVKKEIGKYDFDYTDETAIRAMAKTFDVSSVAMALRILKLGFVNNI